jgi:hypothetical protein
MVRREIIPGDIRRNAQHATADWGFTTAKARRQLQGRYPLELACSTTSVSACGPIGVYPVAARYA